MEIAVRTMILMGLGLGAHLGCSSDDGNDSAGTRTGSDTVSLLGQVVEAPSLVAYAGAVGCVLDSNPPMCAESAVDGRFEIELPANAKTGVTFEVPSMVPMLTPIVTARDDIVMAGRAPWENAVAGVVISQETHAGLAGLIGSSLDTTKGHVDFAVSALNAGTVTLEGGAAGASWYIATGQSVPMPVSAGLPQDAFLLGFTNVDPGTITFRAQKDGQPCEWDPLGYRGDEPGTVTVPIRAGWWTRLLEVRCPGTAP